MASDGFFTVQEFAEFSRTSRDILHHYDKIGILSPQVRGNNQYRYYTSRQLISVQMVRTLQELGMTLAEIKDLKDRRTPQIMDEVFTQQIEKIDDKIDRLVLARKLLFLLRNTINSARDVDEESISIQFLPAEAITLGGLNDYSRDRNIFDALSDFYRAMKNWYPDVNLNYPAWALVSQEQLKHMDWAKPERFYLYNPEGHDKRPAAFYAIGYTRCGYGGGHEIYARLTKYINGHGFEICGDAYEEYPLNELCIPDETNYLMRVMITVRQKNKVG